jgi:hypothetical protein
MLSIQAFLCGLVRRQGIVGNGASRWHADCFSDATP